MKSFYSHGKLLLTGEYVVLDGAKALAVPTIYGQSLTVEKGNQGKLKWISLDENDDVWFETEFDLIGNAIIKQAHDNDPIAERLYKILNATKQLNPDFLTNSDGYNITTTLGFPKHWGLGTSSTLIATISSWASVNPYQLLEATFGGSGYDIACANSNGSITYELKRTDERHVKFVDFNPVFKTHLYFVYLNEKQNSREGIAQYRANTSDISKVISKVSTITDAMIVCKSLEDFQQLINSHEQLISDIIKQTPVKERLFNDFTGSIKSLGAWGGDFVMVACKENPTAYFSSKGYPTIRSYSEMVKN